MTQESEVKDATINGSERPVDDSEYIVRRKRWIPADSAAGSHTASEENRTQVTPTPSASPYWRVGADGTPWGINIAGSIYRFDVPSQSWINTPGVLTSISVGLGAGNDASVWGINAASLIYVFDTQRRNWQNVPGTLSQLAVGFDGTVWGVNGGDLIYRYDPASSTSWDNVPGLLKQISVSSQSVVWGVNAAGSVYRFY